MPVNTVAPLVYRDLRQWTWIPRACGEAAPPWFLWYQMIYSSMDGAGEVGLCEFIYIYSAVVTGETLGCLRISILAFAFFQLDVTLFGVFSICNLPTVMTSHKSVSAFFLFFFFPMLNEYLNDGFQCGTFTVTSFGRYIFFVLMPFLHNY